MRSLLLACALSLVSAPGHCDDRTDRLVQQALDLGDADPDQARQFVMAALSEETTDVPAEVIIRMGWLESRFNPKAGPLCGVMQVNPRDLDLPMSECQLWRESTWEGVRAGMEEVRVMMADHRVHGDVRRMLLYRACGNSAFYGTCHKWGYPRWVLNVKHKE